MRFLLLLLFVSSVLTDEQIAKIADKKVETKKELKKSIVEPKSKTGKRDSSDQTAAFGVNPNDEPFKPMLNSPAPFVAAASDTQQVYYDKNQVKPGEGAGNAKSGTNPQAANAYRAQYSQVAHQQQQQQQNKNHIRVAAKNVGIQQPNQQSILYAAPQNPAYHYERIPQQQQQSQQQQIQLQAPAPQLPQRGQQKQIQYVIAIPLSYLRQIQQQIIHQQQQQQEQQPSHLQVYKGQQQPQQQQQQQLQPIPVYSIAGPLARDHQGAYRPFHRFAPTAVNDVSTGTQQQTPLAQPLVAPASPAPPGYATQYVQIPASVLLAAVQSAQVQQQQQQQQQQRPLHLPQNVYQQQQQQQQLPQLQLQPPIHQQHVQTQSPQLYYYQPQQQQVQLKQSQPSHALTSPPVYAYHVNHLQQPTQQHQTYQHTPEQQQQQQQQNVGRQQQQPHRVRGVRPTANFSPSQFDSSAAAYENEEKAQLVTLQAPTHQNLNAHTHTNAHSQQYVAQAPVAQQQQHQQQTAPAHQVVQAQSQAPEAYEHVVHYNPQYVQHYQEQQQRPAQHQPHRLQIQAHHHTPPLVEHLNNLPFSQGIHGPTPMPFVRLHPVAGLPSFFSPGISQQFVSGGFQPPFNPLGMPSKVTSFTNVLLQPFVGLPSSFQTPEIGTAISGSADSLPYINQSGGIRYGTHLYHPPTSATTVLAANKHHNSAAHPAPRLLTTAGENKVSASSAKASVAVVGAGAAVQGSPTIVKYP